MEYRSEKLTKCIKSIFGASIIEDVCAFVGDEEWYKDRDIKQLEMSIGPSSLDYDDITISIKFTTGHTVLFGASEWANIKLDWIE